MCPEKKHKNNITNKYVKWAHAWMRGSWLEAGILVHAFALMLTPGPQWVPSKELLTLVYLNSASLDHIIKYTF